MKKSLLMALTSLFIFSGVALADNRDRDRDRDWREVHRAQEHVKKAFDILKRIKDDNRLDKDGHEETAINLLRNTKSELDDVLDKMKDRR